MAAAFTFDRFTAANLDDPYPLYQRLREEQPVYYAEEFDLWVVSRYDDVRRVLMDPTRFSSAFRIRTPPVPAPGVPAILAEGHPEVPALLNEDPPEHRRTRDLVATAFSARRIAGLRPRVAELVSELLAAMEPRGRADLVAELATPLPLQVLCALIGLPAADAARIRAWTEQLARLTASGATADEQRAAARESVEFERYLAAAVADRRAAARDDLLTDLVRARGRCRAAGRPGDHQPAGLAGVRRARDDREPHRRRAGAAAAPAGAVGGRGRGPGAGERRGRGDAADRRAGAGGVSPGRVRRAGLRDHDPGRCAGVRAVRLGQPGRCGVRPAGRVRPRPAGQGAAPRVRPRHPFLPRGGAGADRGGDRAAPAPRAVAGSAPRPRLPHAVRPPTSCTAAPGPSPPPGERGGQAAAMARRARAVSSRRSRTVRRQPAGRSGSARRSSARARVSGSSSSG